MNGQAGMDRFGQVLVVLEQGAPLQEVSRLERGDQDSVEKVRARGERIQEGLNGGVEEG